MAIPRILHQIYFQGWDNLPEDTKESIEALRARNPGWEYRFYDAETAEAYIAQRFGQEMLKTYLSIDSAYYAARADLLRYLVCYEDGGVYLDIKSSAARPLDEVLLEDDDFIVSQRSDERTRPVGHSKHPELKEVPGGEYIQWFVMSAAGHPFLERVIDIVTDNIQGYRFWRFGVGKRGVLRTTGPIAYTLAIHPLLERHAHRFVHHETDLALIYSIHGHYAFHKRKYGVHYGTLSIPLVNAGRFETASCQLWDLVYWKIDGAKRRMGLLDE